MDGVGKMKLRGYLMAATVCAAIAGGAANNAWAQEISNSHLAAARSAIAAIQATDRFDDILPNVAEGIKQQLIANNPDLELQINDVVDTETLAMVSRRVDLEDEAARAYAQALSEEHLLAISEFYQSEAGQALLANGAIVGREVQAAAGIWQRGIERDLLENVSKKLSEVAPRVNAEDEANTTEEPASE